MNRAASPPTRRVQLVMRRSGVRFPKAGSKKFYPASGLFRQIIEGQCRLVGPVRAPFSPHLVRIGEGRVDPLTTSADDHL
jgi:hypothetical protein